MYKLKAIEHDQPILLSILTRLFEERLINLSRMVEDGRLSETNARVVFTDIRRWYETSKRKIEGLHVQTTK